MATGRIDNPRSHSDYTIGWVCALAHERAAAMAMLDVEHGPLAQRSNDTNSYTLGSIAEHNIVITCLPMGEIGTTAATTVVERMLSTFPSIRFGLMVGVGGGMPPKVRLGDVVVSVPSSHYHGVVQWDMGKTIQGPRAGDESFERTGSLNRPPHLLLVAVNHLKAQHELGKSRINTFLEQLECKSPMMASRYLRSDALKDVLFQSQYLHHTHNDESRLYPRLLLLKVFSIFEFLLQLVVLWSWNHNISQPQSIPHTQPAQPGPDDSDKFCALGVESDALDDEEDDGDCRFCDPTKIIKRKSRKQPIQIHYGLIVSGNQVIKNALSRDKLNAEFGGHVLCMEMEAAGLMNNFPCLVIRGICDYADSHKNKRWQRHAAAVAAAYAKELLYVVQPVEVNGERAACDIIKEVKQKVVETAENVNYLKRGLRRREDLDVLDWLTPINFGSQHSLYRDKQQRGTGTWFLNSAEYQTWRNEDRKVLFCEGIPGAGKTILSSIVIEDVPHSLAGEIEAAYIYCDYRRQGEQTALTLLSSLTKQFCLSKESLSPGVGALHAKHTSKSTRPSLEEVTQALKDVIKHFTRVYVIVDALDELLDDEDHRNAFVDGLRNLGQSSSNLKLFITSRPLRTDINQFFDDVAKIEISANQDDLGRYVDGRFSKMPVSSPLRANEVLQQEVKDTISQAARGMFLLAQLYMDSLRDKSTPKEVRDVLQGMQRQDNASKKLSVKERLDKAYGETMARIDKQELGFRDRAMQILLWITHAKRPLSTDELRHALAVEVGSNELDEDNLVASLDVSICAGLAMVDDKTQEVRLVHYTTQKYLEQRHFKLSWSINPHNTITEVCVTYLMYSIFKSGPCTLEDQYLERISKYSLYLYAATYWVEHARLSSEASEFLLGFLQAEDAIGAAAQAEFVGLDEDSGYIEDWEEFESEIYAPRLAFHLVVKYGFHKAAEALPERIEALNALYDQKTPLYMALERRDMTMAQILLRKGAQVCVSGGLPILTALNGGKPYKDKADFAVIGDLVEDLVNQGAEITDDDGDCPLLVKAAKYGHEQLVALLLQRGANLYSVDAYDWMGSSDTPLSAACAGGHLKTTMILWKSGADPNRRISPRNRSAFHSAVANGREQLVEMFLGIEDGMDLNISGNSPVDNHHVESLDYGLRAQSHDLTKERISISAQTAVDIELQDGRWRTPLAWAAIYNHCRIAGILLSCGANIENRDDDGDTPLLLAIREQKSDMVKLLLEKGANIEAVSLKGHTPLLAAADRGNSHLAELLLQRGANIEAVSLKGHTPLLAAADRGNSHLAELLLQRGANIDAADSKKYTPLLMAVYKENYHHINLLLENGANIEAADSNGYTPLLMAAYRGNAYLVKLLVDKGADAFARDVDGYTMLMMAAANGNSHLAKLFLQKGVRINGVNERGETALFCAVLNGHASLVKFLLNNGATIEPHDKHGLLKPLAWAEFLGYTDVARVLVEECPDIRNREDDGETLLCLAVRGAEEYWVDKLLKKGAKTEERNGRDQTPLEVALDFNNQHMVDLLCKAGADIEKTDSHGRKHLEHAISKGLVECLKVLLQYGAKTDTGTFNSQTLFEMAYEGGSQDHREVYRVLMEHGGFVLDTTPVEHWDWLRYDEEDERWNNESIDFEAMDESLIDNVSRADWHGEDPDGVPPILDPLQYLPVWVDLIRTMF